MSFRRYANERSAADVAAGTEAEQEYARRARNFNPQAAVRASAAAGYSRIHTQLGRDVSDLRDEQAAMGRLRGGRSQVQEDRLVEDANERVARIIAENSLTATRLGMENDAELGRHGRAVTERGYDLRVSGEESRIMEENLKRQKRRGLGAAIGAGLGIIATGFGAPPGVISGGAQVGAGLFG